jgi:hypothetical protein
MKYLILLILFLICGCSPPSDPELKEIWWKDQAIVLVDGTNNTTLIPHSEGWRIETGPVVNTSVLYSIKGKDPNDLYILSKGLPGFKSCDIYYVIKVYSEPLEKMHNETKPSLWYEILVFILILIICIIPPLIVHYTFPQTYKPNE